MAPVRMRKSRKVRWLARATQFPTQGQWWSNLQGTLAHRAVGERKSYLATQTPHTRQCLERTGRLQCNHTILMLVSAVWLCGAGGGPGEAGAAPAGRLQLAPLRQAGQTGLHPGGQAGLHNNH